MRRASLLRLGSLVGLGIAGLIGGHSLGYVVAVPDVHHRVMFAAQTGHGYIPSASWVAVVVGLAALVAGIASGYARRNVHTGISMRSACARLIPMQVGAFVLLELLERLVAGASFETLSWRLVAVGVAVQALVAVFGALSLVGLRRIGEILAAELRLGVAPPVVERLKDAVRPVVGGRYFASQRVRAPPLAHSA